MSRWQDIPPFLFVLLLHDQRKYVGWVLISARSVKDCISVDRLNAWSTDFKYKYVYVIFSKYVCYIFSSINEFSVGQASPVLTSSIQISLRWHVSGPSIFWIPTRWVILANSELNPKL